MYIMQKITAALRGAARENAEKVIDTHAIRIFEQEIYDCEYSITQAKQDLAKVMAEKVRLGRSHEQRRQAIREKEQQAGKALDKGLDAITQEIADWILEQEQVGEEERKALEKLAAHEKKLRQTLTAAAQHIARYRRELRMVQATQSSQQATAQLAVKANSLGANILCMQESLERIRSRQEQFADMEEAVITIDKDLDSNGLEEKIRQAGLTGSTAREDIIARIKASRSEKSATE